MPQDTQLISEGDQTIWFLKDMICEHSFIPLFIALLVLDSKMGCVAQGLCGVQYGKDEHIETSISLHASLQYFYFVHVGV